MTRRRHAFTLVEVLVSLAIFAIAAVVLAAAYLNVIGGYATLGSRQQQEEDWKFVRMQVLTQPERATLESGGRIGLPDGRQIVWTTKIEPADIPDVFRVTLRANAPAAAGERDAWEHEQTLFLLRPGWSDPTDRDNLRGKLQQQVEKERPQ